MANSLFIKWSIKRGHQSFTTLSSSWRAKSKLNNIYVTKMAKAMCLRIGGLCHFQTYNHQADTASIYLIINKYIGQYASLYWHLHRCTARHYRICNCDLYEWCVEKKTRGQAPVSLHTKCQWNRSSRSRLMVDTRKVKEMNRSPWQNQSSGTVLPTPDSHNPIMTIHV